jgi:hypothetical protein
MKKLIILADIKEYLPQLDREEITISRLAEILNQLANKRSRNYIISEFDAVETLINQLEKPQP